MMSFTGDRSPSAIALPNSKTMKIIRPDGSVEIQKTNPNRKWSPEEILALDLLPDPLLIGDKNTTQRRETSVQAKEKRVQRAKKAREAKGKSKRGKK
jgi:hypothetical protein